jgi:LysM repeat protein
MTKKTSLHGKAALVAVLVIMSLILPQAVHAGGKVHVVRRGENLYRISLRYGTSVSAIVQANGLRNADYVRVGQRLRIPGKGGGSTKSGGARTAPAGGSTHIVRRGESLSSIARRYGTSVSAIVRANGLRNPNYIWTGQRLRIPGKSVGKTTPTGGGGSKSSSGGSGKWIEVDLSSQKVFARQGNTVVRRMVVSTGLSRYPTPTGRFRIYAKYPSVTMSGPGYHLRGVPHTMFFYAGYALHGTYWHHNFGRRMSHGCINLKRGDAAWLYNWAPKGTLVVIHK